jgi:hypothetical protein
MIDTILHIKEKSRGVNRTVIIPLSFDISKEMCYDNVEGDYRFCFGSLDGTDVLPCIYACLSLVPAGVACEIFDCITITAQNTRVTLYDPLIVRTRNAYGLFVEISASIEKTHIEHLCKKTKNKK